MKKFMKRLNGLLTLSLFINPILANQTIQKPTTGVSYKKIGNLLSSPLNHNSIIEESKDNKKIVLEIPELTERDKIEATLRLLSKTESITADNPALIDLLNDLEIDKILNKIDYTVTTFGKLELAHIVANPTNLEGLKNRQELIKELLTNEKLFNEMETLLQEVQRAEKGIFSFWKEENEKTKEFIEKNLFFNKNFLKQFNANPYALEMLTRLGNLRTVYGTVVIPYMLTFFFYGMGKTAAFAAKKAQEQGHTLPEGTVTSYSFLDAVGVTKAIIKNIVNPYHYLKSYRTGKNNLIEQGYSSQQAAKYSLIGTGIGLGINGALLGSQGSITKNTLQQANQTRKAVNYLHTQLIDVATLVNTCKRLVTLSQQNEVLAHAWESQDIVNNGFAPAQTPFSTLLQLLQKKTFQGKASFFSLSGRVLAAHELMKNHKEEFAWLFKAIGEIDAYMSMAKLYKKHQNETLKYNFVNYVTSEKPVIHIKGFWHPLIPAESMVTNDIYLGEGAPSQNMILTGSNTAGKSTTLKGILLNMLLAHTLTLGSFEEMTVTYCDMLGSSLHINDDISAGNSLFKAEVLRAQSLVENAQKLASNSFGFMVIDELFTGTAADKGAKAAYKVAHHLANLPNVIFILATHFPLLTELEENSGGICKNYKMEAFKQEDGTIIRPFKLEEGISTTNIAHDILQNELSEIDFS